VVVQREALRNAVSGCFSSLLCMMALTSVTGMEMTTVYPEKDCKSSKFLNGTILPRAAHNSFSRKLVQDVQLIIMWSRSGITILPGVETDVTVFKLVALETETCTGAPGPRQKETPMSRIKVCFFVVLSVIYFSVFCSEK
jgi:hypothetical protein